MYDFRGKVVLVTGSNRGIGLALTHALAEEDAIICAIARDSEVARNTAFELRRKYGIEALGKECDVRDEHRVEVVVEETARKFGRIDLLINNAAGLGELAELTDTDPHMWSNTIDTNLNGSYYFARAALRTMKSNGGGRIVFVGSSVGREVRAQWGAYSVSKYAVEGLMQLTAKETPSTNVIACSINPGGTATQMRASAFPDEDTTKLPTAAAVAQAFLKIMRKPDNELNGKAFDARSFI